jgi:hypothetical protein
MKFCWGRGGVYDIIKKKIKLFGGGGFLLHFSITQQELTIQIKTQLSTVVVSELTF